MVIGPNFKKFIDNISVNSNIQGITEHCDFIYVSIYVKDKKVTAIFQDRGLFMYSFKCVSVSVYRNSRSIALPVSHEEALIKHFNKLWKKGLKAQVREAYNEQYNEEYIKLEKEFENA